MLLKQRTYIAQLYYIYWQKLMGLLNQLALKIHVMPGLDCRLLRSTTPLSQSIAFTMESGCPKLTVLHKSLVHIYFPYKIQTRPRARRTHPAADLQSPSRHPGSAGTSPSSACRCRDLLPSLLALLFASLSGRSVETILLAGRPCRRSGQATDVYRLRLWCADPVCLYVIRRQQDGHTAAAIRICSSII